MGRQCVCVGDSYSNVFQNLMVITVPREYTHRAALIHDAIQIVHIMIRGGVYVRSADAFLFIVLGIVLLLGLVVVFRYDIRA